MRRITWMGATLVASALVLSACAGTATPTTATTPAPTVGNSINPVDREDIVDGGTLQLALSVDIPNFNPFHVNGSYEDTWGMMYAMLPRPFEWSATAEPTPNTDYFVSIEEVASDPLTLVYEIAPDAVWSDGTPLSVADFAGMWRANRGDDPEYESWDSAGYDQVASIEEGESANEVVVTFDAKYPEWQSLFDPLLPASLTASADAFNTSWVDQPLVTAGPFAWGSEDVTAQTFTLVPDEAWWGDAPKLDSILYRVYAEDSAVSVNALKTGQLDYTWLSPDVASYDAAREIEGIDVRTAASSGFRVWSLNTEDPLLSDVDVRHAITLGIDRARIAATLTRGLVDGAAPMQNHVFLPSQSGYEENCADLCAYDPAAAKDLLADAGWELGSDGYLEKDGETLEVTISIQSGRANSANEAQIAQQSLKDAGIKLTIETIPVDDYFEKHVNTGNFQIAVWNWWWTPLPLGTAASAYQFESATTESNPGAGGSVEIDVLLSEMLQDDDPDARLATANDADVLLWQNAAWIPLYQVPDGAAVRSTLANFGSFGFQSIRYQDIGFVE